MKEIVTGATITDAQIRALLELARKEKRRGTVVVCRIALDDGVTHRTSAQITEARERCAELYNREAGL